MLFHLKLLSIGNGSTILHRLEDYFSRHRRQSDLQADFFKHRLRVQFLKGTVDRIEFPLSIDI